MRDVDNQVVFIWLCLLRTGCSKGTLAIETLYTAVDRYLKLFAPSVSHYAMLSLFIQHFFLRIKQFNALLSFILLESTIFGSSL